MLIQVMTRCRMRKCCQRHHQRHLTFMRAWERKRTKLKKLAIHRLTKAGEAYCECCFRKVPATSIRNCWKKHCSAHQEPLTDCCACGAYLCQADHEEVGDVATHGNLMVQVMVSSRAVLQQSDLPMSLGALAAGSDAVSSPSCYNNFVHGHPRQFT